MTTLAGGDPFVWGSGVVGEWALELMTSFFSDRELSVCGCRLTLDTETDIRIECVSTARHCDAWVVVVHNSDTDKEDAKMIPN